MAELLVRLLGTFQVQQGEVEISRFRGDKVRALLAYLAVESDRPHSRAALAGLLWPDLPDAPALRNLTQAVVRLREALGAEVLETTRQDVRWRREVAEVDVTIVTLLAHSSDLADLVRAADLYRGEFLAGFRLADCSECEDFEAWMLLTRERLLQQALTVLQTVAEQRLAAGHPADAAEAIRRQLALDPWRESAHRQLMGALAATGDRAAALAAYARCCQVLRDDLDVAPDDETQQLAERIEAGDIPRLTAALGLAAPERAELVVAASPPSASPTRSVGAARRAGLWSHWWGGAGSSPCWSSSWPARTMVWGQHPYSCWRASRGSARPGC